MQVLRSARWLMLVLLFSLLPTFSHAGVLISVGFAPPVLPVYEQPICPQPNLMWMPGYWGYGDDGYFWVPGAWVPAPYEGALWTPGYWGWNNGMYVFNDGYWGPQVGYYGGVDYGGGYMGIGFAGGEWRNGSFAYNTAVMHVNTGVIHNTFSDRSMIERSTVANSGHVAYSGGPGGVQHQPTPQEQAAMHQPHTAPTRYQTQHISAARADKTSYAKANGGHPHTLVAAKPLADEKHAAPAGMKTETHAAAATGSKAAGESRTGARTTEHTTASRTTERAAPAHTTEHTATAHTTEHAAPVEHAAPKERAAPAEHAAPKERAAPVEHAAPAEHAAPKEHAAPVEHAAPAEHAAPKEHAAPVERAAPAEHAAPKERAAPAEHSAPAEHAAPKERAAPVEHAAPAPKEEKKKPEGM
jgi:hypothetical protein